MIYKALYLEQKTNFIAGEDIEMTFILLDYKDEIVSDLSGKTFKAEIESGSDSKKLDNASKGGITISGNKINLSIGHTDTDDFDAGYYYTLRMEMVDGSKRYNLANIRIIIEGEIIDF